VQQGPQELQEQLVLLESVEMEAQEELQALELGEAQVVMVRLEELGELVGQAVAVLQEEPQEPEAMH
jgi:hypothetical protein